MKIAYYFITYCITVVYNIDSILLHFFSYDNINYRNENLSWKVFPTDTHTCTPLVLITIVCKMLSSEDSTHILW